jgi:hypothetical protein
MMASLSRDEMLRVQTGLAVRKLQHAGETLAARQATMGPHRGNVPPWPGCDDLDFHGTLAALWVWVRAQAVGGSDAFAGPIQAAWRLLGTVWSRYIPSALGSGASDEAPYDCALLLRAALADPAGSQRAGVRGVPLTAARLLAGYLNDLEDLGGRGFADPGFLAWNLADYARAVGDRGLLASARGFVDRAFGMKSLPPFGSEPAVTEGLFDFSSTTATRVLAVLAAEGTTPFMGAWLRERVAPALPDGFVSRAMDENCWNACLAAALGHAYVVSTDPIFLRGHQTIMNKLDARVGTLSGTIGRQPGFEDETGATFYYAVALDSLIRPP